MKQKLSKWYAVAPYKVNENWELLNDRDEIIAWFKTREDCEKAVWVYNQYVDYENKKNL